MDGWLFAIRLVDRLVCLWERSAPPEETLSSSTQLNENGLNMDFLRKEETKEKRETQIRNEFLFVRLEDVFCKKRVCDEFRSWRKAAQLQEMFLSIFTAAVCGWRINKQKKCAQKLISSFYDVVWNVVGCCFVFCCLVWPLVSFLLLSIPCNFQWNFLRFHVVRIFQCKMNCNSLICGSDLNNFLD